MSADTTEEVETITLRADPKELAQAIAAHDVDYAVEVYAALKLELSPSWMDMSADMREGWTPPPPPDPETFSEQQLEIVRRIHLWTDESIKESPMYKRLEKRAGDRESETMLRYLAYPVWNIERFVDGDITPAKRASASRALKRLKERGIVYRWVRPYGPGRKTHVVALTEEGRRLATRLTS